MQTKLDTKLNLDFRDHLFMNCFEQIQGYLKN